MPKITTITLATSILTFSVAAQDINTDEYGLTVDASHAISMFSQQDKARVSKKVYSDYVSNAQYSASTSITWPVESLEMTRVCEWWDGQLPNQVIDPVHASSLKTAEPATADHQSADVTVQRVCRLWTEYPTHYYGTGHVYMSYDNKLDKPVVIVQPYYVDIEDSGYDQHQFYNDVNQGGLIASLRSAGYDVVLYRYQLQDAGIEFNAQGIKRLVNIINAKPGVTSTSFIGLSMGGVVTRFALKELERTTGLNKVATFVSFDAPHLGANFPRSVIDNTSRLLSKVDSSLCGLNSSCRAARRQLEAIMTKLNTKTFRELIINTPSGASDRNALLNKLSSLGHVNTIPTLALTNGSKSSTQGAAFRTLTTHFKLYRAWYNGGSEYFEVYTNPASDNTPGGYTNFYKVFSDLIANQSHPITPYVTIGQQHSFVSTASALAGSENNFSDVATYPSTNEAHMTLTYDKARKIREWLDTYQY